MKQFNPLHFLASLGAGGISIAPFVYFQYIMPHGKGLATFAEMSENAVKILGAPMFYIMASIMVIFATLHFVLTAKLLVDFFKWRSTPDFTNYINDPQKNTSIMAMFTSIGMTFNVFIGVIRFFVPAMQENFQALMLPALIAWGVLWLLLMHTEIKILRSGFEKDFDIDKISFGWLTQPFALGMFTVSGMGIAAMAQDPNVAHTAAFLALTSGSMGLFLLFVKLITVFKSHFSMSGMPERQFLPSYLIVIPITTLYAISAFRFGHYMEHQFNYHLEAFFMMAVALPFAFQTWYFAFGISMLRTYFKRDFFRKEYYPTLWAFICPFVGYAVLGSFFHKMFAANLAVQIIIFTSAIFAIVFYVFVAIRYFKYHYPMLKAATVKA